MLWGLWGSCGVLSIADWLRQKHWFLIGRKPPQNPTPHMKIQQCAHPRSEASRRFLFQATVMFHIYAAFWVTGNFKTGINLENFPVELDDIQKFSLF
jgi:hypothetical protein